MKTKKTLKYFTSHVNIHEYKIYESFIFRNKLQEKNFFTIFIFLDVPVHG